MDVDELREQMDRLLREQEKHFAAEFRAMALAVSKAEEQMQFRLHNLNEWRKQSEVQANDFARKDAVDLRMDAITQRLAAVEGSRAGTTIAIGLLLTGAGVLIALAVMLLK